MNDLICLGTIKVEFERRKFETPKIINEFLRTHKGRFTNSELSNLLNIPLTQVEHYFRTDRYRAIPSPTTWKALKLLLNFPDIYDKLVTEFESKVQIFEQTRRVYSANGVAPTLNTIGPPLVALED